MHRRRAARAEVGPECIPQSGAKLAWPGASTWGAHGNSNWQQLVEAAARSKLLSAGP